MTTTLSGSHTASLISSIFSAISTRGPRMSSNMALSTLTQRISPAEASNTPAARARIFSDIVLPNFHHPLLLLFWSVFIHILEKNFDSPTKKPVEFLSNGMYFPKTEPTDSIPKNIRPPSKERGSYIFSIMSVANWTKPRTAFFTQGFYFSKYLALPLISASSMPLSIFAFVAGSPFCF